MTAAMNCTGNYGHCGAGATNRKKLTLYFKRENLLYDIKNLAYVEGDIMPDEAQHAKHATQDIGEEGNEDRVSSVLGVVHAAVCELLYPYTKHETEEEMALTDDPERPELYVIDMEVPVDFSHTTAVLLERLIHEYMVYRVLSDWLGMTNGGRAAVWESRAAAAASEIRRNVNNRPGRTRRRLHPF